MMDRMKEGSSPRPEGAGEPGKQIQELREQVNQLRQAVQELRTRGPKGVQRPDFDEALQRALAHQPQIGALAEVIQRAEWAAGLARLEHGLHRALAHVLDGGQTKANLVVLFDREIQPAGVHVRRHRGQ